MGYWDSNVYYSPEQNGLKIVLEVEEDLFYEFNKFVVWTDGEHFYTATDSGCSCPSPFEDLTHQDLIKSECSVARLHVLLDDWAESCYSLNAGDVADAHLKISELSSPNMERVAA
jgi:hypothetical protein